MPIQIRRHPHPLDILSQDVHSAHVAAEQIVQQAASEVIAAFHARRDEIHVSDLVPGSPMWLVGVELHADLRADRFRLRWTLVHWWRPKESVHGEAVGQRGRKDIKRKYHQRMEA